MSKNQSSRTASAEVPRWAIETTKILYELNLFDTSMVAPSPGSETIELTRQEYIALKRHLAVMRGHDFPHEDESPEPAADVEPAETEDKQTLEPIAVEDEDELEFLTTCQRLYRSRHGHTTPFENFFWELVDTVQCDIPMVPKIVKGRLEEFQENFNDMQRDAKAFMEAYPKLFESPEAA